MADVESGVDIGAPWNVYTKTRHPLCISFGIRSRLCYGRYVRGVQQFKAEIEGLCDFSVVMIISSVSRAAAHPSERAISRYTRYSL